ncbi:isoaspartyl peptidase/L-asparaginase [Devosia sp. BK]|uniref:isoaspartyl peptidase/L-asparaginase family protein n=1 Tax=Devosia sp. BK TaxID=2871706 RepID=UPI00293AE8CA|nr:isoaspartyl peptidase/L-asparaginase [Devosia sp. BK]MDV3251105.1 isoaspartyl peptidase/L-asparaginase [Devosia sp. BK]
MATLAIHGGAGTIPRGSITEEGYRAAREGLRAALAAGWSVLKEGGLAIDAVEAAVVALEDHPSFNAAHGAILNERQEHELDAGIMDGRTLAAGAIASARHIRNPIQAARLIMEDGTCLLLSGAGADDFARGQGLAMVEQDYFTTPLRKQHWQRAEDERTGKLNRSRTEAEKHGTVGAVALDDAGNLAAATSTGGYTFKRAGRVGDAPIIGAGTYARNGVVAVSCTGLGEYFIRRCTAHDIASRMLYLDTPLADATQNAVNELKGDGAGAGIIAIDRHGAISLVHNTEGMYRGKVSDEGVIYVGIYADDFGAE